MSVGGVGDAPPGGACVRLRGAERQEGAAIIVVLVVDPQQTQVRGEVPERAGFGLVGAVHLPHVKEGRQSVHLLPLPPGGAGRRRADEWHTEALGNPGVAGRNLGTTQEPV